MKSLTKFVLSAALCGVFAGCGSDSSTSAENGGSESVATSSASHVILSGGSAEVEESSCSSEMADQVRHDEVESSSSAGDASSSSMETAWDYLNPKISYGEMTDSRDGQIYKTVVMGSLIWMAQNLNYAYLQKTADEDSSSFCNNNSADSCSKYGRLYLWSAAMDSAAVFSENGKGCGSGTTCSASENVRGVCPEGWHLPDTTEWRTLFTIIGGEHSAGRILKSTSGWKNDGNGEDTFGFSALPADVDRSGDVAYFWSSTEHNNNYVSRWYFDYRYASADDFHGYKGGAYSVRCVKSIIDVSEYDASTNTLTDLRDGQTYKTVTIGEQTWMAENLNYNYNYNYNVVTALSFCYDYDTSYCDTYGRFYTWGIAMDSLTVFSKNGKGCGHGTTCSVRGNVRGVCPNGWHLPSNDEWSTLFAAVGGTDSAGTKLKSTSGWSQDGNGEDSFGFSALPAGYHGLVGGFHFERVSAWFWSSTENDGSYAYSSYVTFSSADVSLGIQGKYSAVPIRCLKD